MLPIRKRPSPLDDSQNPDDAAFDPNQSLGEMFGVNFAATPDSEDGVRYPTADTIKAPSSDPLSALASMLDAKGNMTDVPESLRAESIDQILQRNENKYDALDAKNLLKDAELKSQVAAQTAEDVYNRPGQAKIREEANAAAVAKARAEHPITPLFPGMEGLGEMFKVPSDGGGASPDFVGPTEAATPAASAGSGAAFDKVAGHLPPQAQSLLKGILNYTQVLPTGSTALKAYAPLFGLAQQIDPSWDFNAYQRRQKLGTDLTSGEAGQRLRSLNQLSGHVEDFDKLREELNNFNVGGKAINVPINTLEKFFGSGKFGAFDPTRGLVESELGKLMAGGNATDELRRALGGDISSNSSDEQLKRYIDAVSHLSARAFEALQAQTEGAPGLQDLVKKQLTPAALALLERSKATNQGGLPSGVTVRRVSP